MKQKHYTKDELFILCLYEAAQALKELESPFDRYEIGKNAGITTRGVDAICKLLIQANFIKKEDESKVYLTENGCRLVHTLLEEN